MPIYATIFPQDFWEHNFQQGGHGPPLESPMRAGTINCESTWLGLIMMVNDQYNVGILLHHVE